MIQFLACFACAILGVGIAAAGLFWAVALAHGGAGPEAMGIAIVGIGIGVLVIDYAERLW